jgi:hypothetical protein
MMAWFARQGQIENGEDVVQLVASGKGKHSLKSQWKMKAYVEWAGL